MMSPQVLPVAPALGGGPGLSLTLLATLPSGKASGVDCGPQAQPSRASGSAITPMRGRTCSPAQSLLPRRRNTVPSAGWARWPGRRLGPRSGCRFLFLPLRRSPAPAPGPRPGPPHSVCKCGTAPGPAPPEVPSRPAPPCSTALLPRWQVTQPGPITAAPRAAGSGDGLLPPYTLPAAAAGDNGGKWPESGVEKAWRGGWGVPLGGIHPAAGGWGRCSQLPWGHGAQGTRGTGVPLPPLLLPQPLLPPPLVPFRCSRRDGSGRSGLPAAAISI